MAVSTSGTDWHDSNRGVSLYITVYLSLFSIILVLSKKLHDLPRVAALIPEAGMVILVGMVAGLFIWLFGSDNSNLSYKPNKNYYNDGDDAYVQNADYADQDNGNQQSYYDNMAQSILSFSPTVFFVILLPPIIFNSGYHVQRDLFFRHLTPICMFAFGGTAICTVVVASILKSVGWIFFPTFDETTTFLELLTFGALISATDPVSTLAVFSSKKVDPHLFYLVFGESVLNDAVGLVLFDALAHLLENHMNGLSFSVGEETMQFLFDFGVAFVGSLGLGIVFALAVALLLKYLDFRRTPLIELCIASSLMYFPFTIAEILHLSGIVTVLFAGIASKRYVEPNLSITTQSNADWVYRLTAHVTETIIFLELGLSVWQLLGNGAFSVGFALSALVACLIGRAVNIYPLTFIFNSLQQCNMGWIRRKSKQEDHSVDNTDTMNASESSKEPETNFTSLDMPDDDNHHRNDTTGHNGGLSASMSGDIHDENSDDEDGKDDSLIPWRTAHMLWFSGLRGAVSYGLVRTFPSTENKATIVVTTMLLVLLTTFVLGGSTEWMLKHLHIPMNIDENGYLDRLKQRKLLPGFLIRFENQRLYQWVTRRQPVSGGDGISKKSDDDQEASGNNDVSTGKISGANDEDDALDHGYDQIEVTERDLRSHGSTVINRKGKIFDYGA